MHDVAYLKSRIYKKYSDSPISKPVHQAVFASFIISFIIFSGVQYIFPHLDFFSPSEVKASSNSVTWTTNGDFAYNKSSLCGQTTQTQIGISGAQYADATCATSGIDSSISLFNGINYRETTIAAGNGHSLIVKTDETLWSTGNNGSGRLGLGDTTQRTSFTQTNLTNVIAVAGGGSHSLALKSDGTVWTAGLNSSGQLGQGDTTQRTSFTQTNLTNVVAVAGGSAFSLALKSDGTVWATGLNTSGQLGLGDNTQRNSFVQTNLTGITGIAAGSTHSLALKNDGTVWSVGANTNGQLGLGDTSPRNTFTQTNIVNVISIAAAGHSLALKNDGSVWSTGPNSTGQLGLGDNSQRTSFTQTDTTGVLAIAASSGHSLVLKNDRTVWSTGNNTFGQLGLGDSGQRTSFTQTNITDVIFIAAGFNTSGQGHSLALKTDGTIWSAGYNSFGQLGQGDENIRNTFTQTNQGSGKTPTLSYFSPGTISGFKIDSDPGQKSKWGNISWNATTPTNTAVKFNVRTSDDNNTWSDWSSDVLSPGAITANVSRYLEIKVTLSTSDGLSTPTLNNFTVTYDTLEAPQNTNLSLAKIGTVDPLRTSSGIAITNGVPGGYTNETSIKVAAAGLSCTGCGTSTNIRPEVEIKPLATAFDGTGTVTADVGNNYSVIGGLANDTSYHVRVRAIDDEGRASAWTSYGANAENEADFTIEQTLPNGTVLINSGSQYISSTDVVLTLSASDTGGSNLSQMRLSNDGLTWSDWMNYQADKYDGTPDSWDLTLFGGNGNDGEKKVYVQLKDNAGNTTLLPTLPNFIDGREGSALESKQVYYQNSADAQWKTTDTTCSSPECEVGLDASYPDDRALVSPQTSQGTSFALYPAQNECKAIEGRLPYAAEIQEMYDHQNLYGDNFGNGDFWIGTELFSSGSGARLIDFGGGNGFSAKNNIHHVRCIRDTDVNLTDSVTLDTQPPAQPSNLKAYDDSNKGTEYNPSNWYSDNNVYFEWTDDPEVVEYRYCIDSNGTCTPTDTLSGDNFYSADLSALSDGVKHFRILGLDGATNASLVADVIYNMDTNIPGAVTGLAASTNDLTKVVVNWNAATTGSPLDNYRLERVKYSVYQNNLWDVNSNWSGGDGYGQFTFNGPTHTTSFNDDSTSPVQGQVAIEPSVRYIYRVKVKDVANSEYSNYQSNTVTGLTRDSVAPTDPSNVVATACDGTAPNCLDVANKGFEIKLTWTVSADAGTGILRYDIYRASSTPDNPASFEKIGEAVSPIFYDNDAIHSDPADRLNDYSTYYYRVVALDNATPANQSPLLPPFDPSLNIDSGTTPDVTNPSVPSDVTATALGLDSSGERQRVQITWSASTDTKARSSENGSGIKEYHVYRAMDQNGPYSDIATVNHPEIEYLNENLDEFTYYYYKVSAVDNANNPTDQTQTQSDYSSVRTASNAVPTVPTNVTVISKKGNPVNDPEVGDKITLTFKGSYAKNCSNNIRCLVKYEVYRSGINYASQAEWLANATKLNDITPQRNDDDRDNTYTVQESGLNDSTIYYYKVRALDNTPANPDGGPFTSSLSAIAPGTLNAGWDITPDVTGPTAPSTGLDVSVKDTHPNDFELRNIITWRMLTGGDIPKRKKYSYETCDVIATEGGVQYCSDFAKYEVHREVLDPLDNHVLSDDIVASKTTINDNYYIDVIGIAFVDSKFKYYVTIVDNAGTDFKYQNGSRINDGFSNSSEKQYWADSIIPSKSNPSLLGSVSLSDVQVASATVSWGTDQDTDSIVQFRPKDSNDDWLIDGQVEKTTSHIVRLNGLKPLTEYEYQIISRNYLGNNIEDVGTLPQLVTTGFSITQGEVTATTSTADINWSTNLSASSAFVEYQLQKQPGDEAQSGTAGVAVEDLASSPRNHRVVVKGLRSNRTYTYKIKSISTDGFVAETEFLTFKTRAFDQSQFTLAPSSSNVAERNITATTALIAWQTSMATTSWVDYSTKSGIYDMSAGNNDLNTSHAVQLEGLVPGTKYFYRVRVKDANEVEYTSQEYSFTAVLKPKISNMKLKDVTPYSVTISWDTNVETETLINWGKSSTYGEKRGIPGLTKVHEIKVDNLEDNIEYHYQILAKDETSNEVADDDKIVRTPLDTEGPKIENVKTDILPIGADEANATVVVSWQTNKPATTLVEYDEGIIGGKYTMRSVEDKTLNNSHTVIIKDLKPASSYHFKIVSKDRRGNIGQSPDHTFVTPTKEKSILQLILRSLEETFAWTKNMGQFFANIGKRMRG